MHVRQRHALNGIAHRRLFLARRRGRSMTVVAVAADAGESTHPFHRCADSLTPITEIEKFKSEVESAISIDNASPRWHQGINDQMPRRPKPWLLGNSD
jgi:hypothetical protein